MFGQYKRIRNVYEGVLTGKGLNWGGSLARTEATGYGLLYFTEAMLKDNGKDIKGATVCVSGAGNVAIYATEKATELGAKVVTMADSTGWIYDAEGIDLDAIKEIKEVKRQRLQSIRTIVLTQSITKANSIGQLSVMLHFHVLHRMSLTKKTLKDLSLTVAMLLPKALTCLQLLRLQSFSRNPAFSLHRVRLLMQAVLLHQLLR